MPEPAKSAPKKGSQKAMTKTAGKGGKQKRQRRKESHAIYVYKVLSQVHPDTGVSSKAVSIVNSFVNDICERIAAEASRLGTGTQRGRSRSLPWLGFFRRFCLFVSLSRESVKLAQTDRTLHYMSAQSGERFLSDQPEKRLPARQQRVARSEFWRTF